MSKPTDEKNIDIPLEVITKILTSSELRMLQNRWEILNLLLDGLSVRKVAAELHVGTDTVVRTSRMLESEELRNLLVLVRTGGVQENAKTAWSFGTSRDDE